MAELFGQLVAAVRRSDVLEVEDAPFAESSDELIVAELESEESYKGRSVVIGIPPADGRRVAKHALKLLRQTSDESEKAAASNVLLLVNPGWAPGWMAKQKRLAHVALSDPLFASELMFNDVALRRKPKSTGAWQFRGWALRRTQAEAAHLLDVEAEVHLALLCCKRYPRNYNSWAYLLQVHTLDNLSKPADRVAVVRTIRSWSSTCPSDHSALAFVQAILSHMRANNETDGYAALVRDERCHCLELLQRRPSHESVWYHLRYVTLTLHDLVSTEGEDLTEAESLVEAALSLWTASKRRDGDTLAQRDAALTEKWATSYWRWVYQNIPALKHVGGDLLQEA